MRRTRVAVKQAVYARLTSPPIGYSINNGPPLTVPAANVQQRAIWTPGVGGKAQPPSPYVAFSVGNTPHDTLMGERVLELKIWVSSTQSDSEVDEIYEAIRALLHGADDEATPEWATFPPPTLSQVATSTTLALTVRRCREQRALAADFEPNSARWYVSAQYRIVAV